MEFEFDLNKSKANQARHGIDFDEAQELWDDPDLIEIPGRSVDEPRSLMVGTIGARHWSAVVTYREGRTRIISVRRSRVTEKEIYEGK